MNALLILASVCLLPDKFVGGYAYGTWRSVPIREKVHPNVIIGFVGLGYFDQQRRQDDLRYWDGWSKLATLSAAEQAASADPAAAARVKFLREGLRYAELRAPALKLREQFKRAPADRAKRKEFAEAVAPLKAYYVQQATTWVIAPQLVRMTSEEMPQRPSP